MARLLLSVNGMATGAAKPDTMPIIDSRKLLAFVTLVKMGSFTLAARELEVTQSAVSHAIKSLEDDLQLRLVDRRGRKIRLTPPGKELLRHANRILAEMKEARDDLALYIR